LGEVVKLGMYQKQFRASVEECIRQCPDDEMKIGEKIERKEEEEKILRIVKGREQENRRRENRRVILLFKFDFM
jgi:hypothetical protein